MNVSLTPELSPFVEGPVKSGRHQTASVVVREGRPRPPVGIVRVPRGSREVMRKFEGKCRAR